MRAFPLAAPVVLAAALFAGSAIADDRPQFPLTLHIPALKTSYSQKPAIGFRLGAFHGVLERTTLLEVAGKLGGQIYERGTQADHTYLLCYSTRSPHATERVWLSSDAEMGGANHRINQVALEFFPPQRATTPGCPDAPSQFRDFRIGENLRLLMTPAQVINTMGSPSGAVRDFRGSGGMIGYAYEKPVDDGDDALAPRVSELRNRGFSIYNDLVIRAAGGRVNGIRASRVTSN
jgi:hypothetical protein